ncbi:MAG TPA: sodium-dependent transporter, partial [Bdellovibrio sp.]
IGLLEVVVSNWVDAQKKMERGRATWYSGMIALVLTILPALSSSIFKDVRVLGRSLIESLDSLLINWFLPMVALGILMAYNWGVAEKEKELSFVDKDKFVSYTMYPHWSFTLKWAAPLVIILGLVMQMIDLWL